MRTFFSIRQVTAVTFLMTSLIAHISRAERDFAQDVDGIPKIYNIVNSNEITLTPPQHVPFLSSRKRLSVCLFAREFGASHCWDRADRTMWLATVGSPILLAPVVLAASSEVLIKGCPS